ncbi:MAG: hypothetical protein JW841_15165 [Deltaproteobacteria bacterium]|nr:hypothetical protein [Deltaproteobacteria bacterium]
MANILSGVSKLMVKTISENDNIIRTGDGLIVIQLQPCSARPQLIGNPTAQNNRSELIAKMLAELIIGNEQVEHSENIDPQGKSTITVSEKDLIAQAENSVISEGKNSKWYNFLAFVDPKSDVILAVNRAYTDKNSYASNENSVSSSILSSATNKDQSTAAASAEVASANKANQNAIDELANKNQDRFTASTRNAEYAAAQKKAEGRNFEEIRRQVEHEIKNT